VLTAPIFGPMVGGWLSDNISWRACFYINLPVGLVSAAIVWALLRRRDSDTVRLSVDYVGAGLLIAGIAALQFMLDNGNEKNWFESGLIVGLGLTAAVALMFFAGWERFELAPIVDFSLMRRRNYAVGLVSGSLGHAVSFASIVLHPLWLQTTSGYSASQAGMAVVGYGASALVTSLWLGTVIQRLPLRATASVGLCMFIVGVMMQAQLTTDASFWQYFWARTPQGIAVPLFQMSVTSLSLVGLPPSQLPAASSLMAFSRTLSGSFATAVTIWIWDYRSKVHHSNLAEGFDAVSTRNLYGMFDPGAFQLTPAVLARVEALAQQQSRTAAFADVCWLRRGHSS